MLKNFQDLQYKEFFLYIFFITLIIGTFIISIVSLFLKNYPSLAITGLSFLFGLFMLYRYNKNKNFEEMSLMLLWSIAFIIFSHVFINDFEKDIVYSLMLPMTAPILLSRKKLIFHGGIYLFITLAVVIYGFMTHQFTDPRAISGFAILSGFVLLFGTTYHLTIEASYKKLEESNKQKAFLLKEIHHRVKNNLNIVASILGLEKFESDIEEVHKLINQNKLRIESIAMVHEILYESSNLESIDFKTYISKLTKHILTTESNDEEIELNINIIKLSLSIEDMMQFGIIINELMTNSIKYAFPNKEGKINIFLIQEEHSYKLTYQDNGVGFQESKQGFGSSLIEMSIQQLDGELNIINQDGLSHEIYFKGEKNENTYR
jgi:two-component sensor histidine kinase